MRRWSVVGLGVTAFALAACETPTTTLRHPTTGQIATCGGNISSSMAGGMIGYGMQQSSDQRCVDRWRNLGFQPVR